MLILLIQYSISRNSSRAFSSSYRCVQDKRSSLNLNYHYETLRMRPLSEVNSKDQIFRTLSSERTLFSNLWNNHVRKRWKRPSQVRGSAEKSWVNQPPRIIFFTKKVFKFRHDVVLWAPVGHETLLAYHESRQNRGTRLSRSGALSSDRH